MRLDDIPSVVADFAKTLPAFPDGRIDYTHSKRAPVVTVFVQYKKRILLLRRSTTVSTYKGMWNTVAGYLDEPVPLRQKVLEELREELGITEQHIMSITQPLVKELHDATIDRTWVIHSVLAIINTNKITLDWEHEEYVWILPEDIPNYAVVPKLEEGLQQIIASLS